VGKLEPMDGNNTFTLTNNFLRKYAVVLLGNAGWRNNNSKSHEPVPREKEFFRIWSERKIKCFSISEFRTSKVNFLNFNL
jgi:hypothetical protein